MNSARLSLSRNLIFEWINHTLKIKITKIQQLGSGVVYCLLLDAAYPYRVPIHKLKWLAYTEVDCIHNFKILQVTFGYLGIDKKIQINKLIKAKYQDNLEFVQWFKYCIEKEIKNDYDPLKRRNYHDVCLDFCQNRVIQRISSNNTIYININNKEETNNYHKLQKNNKILHKNARNKIYNEKQLRIHQKNKKPIIRISKQMKKKYQLNDDYYNMAIDIDNQMQNTTDNQTIQLINHNQQQQIYQYKQRPNKNISRSISSIAFKHTKCQQKLQNNNDLILQNNKQNNFLSINTDFQDEQLPIKSVSTCKYTSPKQIKKFFFPERFSLRLINRVNKINNINTHQLEDMYNRNEEKVDTNNQKYYGSINY